MANCAFVNRWQGFVGARSQAPAPGPPELRMPAASASSDTASSWINLAAAARGAEARMCCVMAKPESPAEIVSSPMASRIVEVTTGRKVRAMGLRASSAAAEDKPNLSRTLGV